MVLAATGGSSNTYDEEDGAIFEIWRMRVAVLGGWVAGVFIISIEMIAPARARGLVPVVLIVVGWVAFLVIADAYLVLRRRRMIRPDYVAAAVAVGCLLYASYQPVHWASVASVLVGLVAAISAISLRFHRSWWTTRDPALRTIVVASKSAGVISARRDGGGIERHDL